MVQFDWGPAPVTRLSQPWARTSARMYSRPRSLLPPRPTPARSSRLNRTGTPSSADSRGARCSGVGPSTSGADPVGERGARAERRPHVQQVVELGVGDRVDAGVGAQRGAEVLAGVE